MNYMKSAYQWLGDAMKPWISKFKKQQIEELE